ncbi:putative Histone H2B [Cocos nucifera]|nr:putative Histone H2B [Cocos nucifera]EHA8590838.1 putative Histone H2B [Cocos nucifera]EHA8590839.1 putative Histone H2B [Cocos nucifera]
MAKKVPAEKRTKAEKHLLTKEDGAGDKKKKRVKEGREIHMLKVVKMIHLDIEFLSKAMNIMNFINDIFKKACLGGFQTCLLQ